MAILRDARPESHNLNEKLLPESREAEMATLGSALIDPDALGVITGVLRGPDDFYFAAHRLIYQAMLTLDREGAQPDLIAVIDRLRDHGHLEDAGGASTISSLANHVPTSANVARYARIVREKAERRSAITLAGNLAGAAYSADNEAWAAFKRTIPDALSDDDPAEAAALPVLTDVEAEALPPPRGILGDILFEESVSYLYGPSGRWKSFVALSWALAIATGSSWLGRPVVEGDVLYICSEGARGVGNRVTAWKRYHGVTGATRLRIMSTSIDLTNAGQMSALIRRIAALELTPSLIVFDTLAASSSGDENASETAAAVDRAARRIIRATNGACVLIVHHTGYDASHMRGSTAYFSNADTVIRIEGGDANRRIEPGAPITLISDKPKDTEPFRDIYLTTAVQTWVDEYDQLRSSLVVCPCNADVAKATRGVAALSPKRLAALALLEDAGDAGLSASAWQRASGMSHSAFYDALTAFLTTKLVTLNDRQSYIRSPAGPVVRSGPV